MYYFTYPFKKMSISQNYKQGNHKPHWYNSKKNNDYPIDECCGDSGRSPVYAPVDMKIVKIYGLNTTKTTNSIVLQTTAKVRTPIGNRIVIMTLTHPKESDIKKLKVGQIIKKGNIICYEGRDGYATGNHIHMTVGTGSFKGLLENSNGKWCFIESTVNKPEEIFYVNTKFTSIKNSNGINFKKISTDRVAESGSSSSSNFLGKRGYLKYGDSGENIHKLCQFFANDYYGYFGNTKKSAHDKLLGEKGNGDYFGVNLKAWVTEFQRRTGLEADGNIGPLTLKMLVKYGFRY